MFSKDFSSVLDVFRGLKWLVPGHFKGVRSEFSGVPAPAVFSGPSVGIRSDEGYFGGLHGSSR